jgi:DHA2 family multidrug resistance protein
MAFAMSMVALAMWHSTALSPDADFDFFVWMRVFQVVALPFLFIPISTAAYAGLPPDKTNQASALINVARNLGGSIGVSAATAMLAQRGQFHQSRLVESIYPSSQAFQQFSNNAGGYLAPQGFAGTDTQSHAIALLGQQIQAQSSLLAYVDVFWLFAIFAALMVPLALTLKSVKAGQGAPAH